MLCVAIQRLIISDVCLQVCRWCGVGSSAIMNATRNFVPRSADVYARSTCSCGCTCITCPMRLH
jgi:hypothetical protein